MKKMHPRRNEDLVGKHSALGASSLDLGGAVGSRWGSTASSRLCTV